MARDRSMDWQIREDANGTIDVYQGRKQILGSVGSVLGAYRVVQKGFQDGQKVFLVASDGYRADITRNFKRRSTP